MYTRFPLSELRVSARAIVYSAIQSGATVRLFLILLVTIVSGPELWFIAGTVADTATPQGAGSEGGPGPPWAPKRLTEATSEVTYWTIACHKRASTADAAWVKSSLTNRADHRLRFAPVGEPIVELTGPDGQARRLPLSRFSPPRVQHLRNPKPGEALHEVEFGLTAGFGQLDPGRYTVRVVWPAESMRLWSWDGPVEGEQASPTLEFEIVAVSLKQVRETLPTALYIERIDPPKLLPDGTRSPPLGIFINRSGQALFVPYASREEHGHAVRVPPLKVPLEMLRWMPGGVFQPVESREHSQPPNLETLLKWEVPPGGQVEIVLEDWLAVWDGIYCFKLQVFETEQRVPGLHHWPSRHVLSEPFQVRSTAPEGVEKGNEP